MADKKSDRPESDRPESDRSSSDRTGSDRTGSDRFDLIVLGAGPGGYVAAIRARQLGLSVALVERDRPGGVCLNMGCIPSKSLIHHASVLESALLLRDVGVTVDGSGLDYAKVHQKSREAAQSLSRGVESLLKKNGIELIKGSGAISGLNEVAVDGKRTLRGNAIILATGSRPREIEGMEFDGEAVLSSDHALMLTRLPKSLLILGGGPIGVEFAYVMNAFGVKVHIVELMERILPLEDAQTVRVVAASFRKAGIEVSTGMQATSVARGKKGVKLTVSSSAGEESTLEAEKLLVVVGRTPNTQGIGLEAVGLGTDRGFVPVGDYYQSPVPGIFAIGDIVASPMLAHVASKEGEIAVARIAGRQTAPRLDPLLIPSAVYAEPQLASFGLTEQAARERGVSYASATFPYRGAGKSVAIERTEGLAKVLYDPGTHEILGAHVAGADATEIIHELLLARSSELLAHDIAELAHAHPTLSEVVMELMRAAEGWAIHA